MIRDWCGASPLLVLLVSAFLTGCAGSEKGPGTTSSTNTGRVIAPGAAADGLTVTFASQPDPPEEGDNTFQITVKQADGSPLTDATVTAVFSMAAMPSMNMPAMRSDATLQHQGDGWYRGAGQLSMGGTWSVLITISRHSRELATRRFSVVAKE